MVLSIEQIKNLIEPVAKKYHLRAVYVFGSYARGEATPNSDIDLLIDRECSYINSMFDIGICIMNYTKSKKSRYCYYTNIKSAKYARAYANIYYKFK